MLQIKGKTHGAASPLNGRNYYDRKHQNRSMEIPKDNVLAYCAE